MIIGGFQKLSLIDYPSKLAAVIFTRGCNFRCPYCHNPELIGHRGCEQSISVETVFDHLARRVGLLEGVVITGGEPTLQADMIDFMELIKNLGYSIKLDTNGSNPKAVLKLIENNLLDYIAMDIKAPFDKYHRVAGQSVDIESIRRSIEIITNSGIDFQFRTTLARPFLDYQDATIINEMIKPSRLHLQECQVESALNKSLRLIRQFSGDDIREFQYMLENEPSSMAAPDSKELKFPFSFSEIAL